MDDRSRTDRELMKGTRHGIERVLVALDPSAHSRAALHAAARIASRFDAELLALFVEDANIRRLTELPFVQEVGIYSGSCRQVEVGELSRQLRVQAGSMRQEFRVATRRIRTRCTFRRIRGRVAAEVLRVAVEADVIILGKGAWSAVDTGRIAPDVREILRRATISTLLLQAEAEVQPPMRVVYDGSGLAARALSVAARLAEDGDLTVFVLANDPERAEELVEQVNDLLKGSELEPTFKTLTEASVSRLAYVVAHEGPGTLVLPADPLVTADDAVLEFLGETSNPVLMIR